MIKNKIFDTTILLALIPAYIYFCSFMYEIGICYVFNIPLYLIEPSLTTILIFAFSISLFLFSFIKALGMAVPLFDIALDDKRKHLKMIALINGANIVICLFVIFVFPIKLKLFLYLGLGVLITNFLYWILPLIFRYKQNATVKEKLADIKVVKDHYSLLNRLLDTLHAEDSFILLMLLLVPVVSYFVGKSECYKKYTYEVVYSNPSQLVLRKYGSILICRDYNAKLNTLGDSLIMRKMDASDILVLKKISLKEPLNFNDDTLLP